MLQRGLGEDIVMVCLKKRVSCNYFLYFKCSSTIHRIRKGKKNMVSLCVLTVCAKLIREIYML